MKLSVLQENLNYGLTTVSRVISTKAQLPVLGNILLATDKGRLKLSTTNLETGINFWLGAKIENQGAISIPAKILTEYISSLSPQIINLEVKENNLLISCGSSKASFIGLPASEFPIIPTLKEKPEIFLKSSQLSLAITQVTFAAAQDEGRPVLTGVLIQTKGENLILVATDGYRLSFKKLQSTSEIQKFKEFQKGLLIPAGTLIEVGRIISQKDEEKNLGLTVAPQVNQVIFSTPEAEIISRLIEGKFPDFEKIIPQKGLIRIIVDTEGLLRAVRTAAIFARESANIVKFKIQNEKLKISANAAQVGENISEIEVKTEGEGGSIAFNSRYLLDFLNSVKSELINFEMTDSLSPGLFTPVGDKSYLHLIMPVRVQE
jgi:DNA polymerase-3 subunit beta